MLVVTVATSEKLFYPALVQSCEKFNYQLITLGKGIDYESHQIKDTLV